MSTFTIITVWNKPELFSEFQQELARQQGVAYTLLGVDNSQNRYPGAREAFLSQMDQVQTEFVVFMHQDIRFQDETALKDILASAEALDNLGVAGVAGCPEGRDWILYSDIVHGKQALPAGKPVKGCMPVQTVDECLFLMRTEIARKYPFTRRGGWHMYAVEQCLELLRAGYQNYVLSARVWHLSKGGSLEQSYLHTLEELIEKYGDDTDYFNTTVKQWATKGRKAALYRVYYLYKMKLKGFLQRNLHWLKDGN